MDKVLWDVSTGLIDLYDFTVNLKESYPHVISNIEAVQNSINSTILYSSNGNARPNAKGISEYICHYLKANITINPNLNLQTLIG